MPQFTWDGSTFDLIADRNRWRVREVIELQDYFGMPVERLDSGRTMQANLWVSVHRVRPEFTLAQAGEVEYGDPQIVPEPEPPAAPQEEAAGEVDEPGEVVLTPTPGGSDESSSTPSA